MSIKVKFSIDVTPEELAFLSKKADENKMLISDYIKYRALQDTEGE